MKTKTTRGTSITEGLIECAFVPVTKSHGRIAIAEIEWRLSFSVTGKQLHGYFEALCQGKTFVIEKQLLKHKRKKTVYSDLILTSLKYRRELPWVAVGYWSEWHKLTATKNPERTWRRRKIADDEMLEVDMTLEIRRAEG